MGKRRIETAQDIVAEPSSDCSPTTETHWLLTSVVPHHIYTHHILTIYIYPPYTHHLPTIYHNTIEYTIYPPLKNVEVQACLLAVTVLRQGRHIDCSTLLLNAATLSYTDLIFWENHWRKTINVNGQSWIFLESNQCSPTTHWLLDAGGAGDALFTGA